MSHTKRVSKGLIFLFGCCLFPMSAQADLLTNLQGYWQFNSNGADSSTAARSLNLVGSPGFGTGLFGQALSLTGNATQFAQRPVSDTVFDVGGSDFTIQVWTNFNSTAGEQTLLEKFTGGAGPGYTLTKLSSNRIQFFGQGLTIIETGGLSINAGQWHQVIMRRSGNDFDIFFNNNSVAQSNQSGAVTSSANPLLIGEREGSQQFPVNGLVDEVAFWDRGLSNAEIDQLYNSGNGLDLTAVPEPAAISLLAVFGALMVQRRRRACPTPN